MDFRKIAKIILSPKFILAIYIAIAVFASVQAVLIKTRAGDRYTHYNNYVIFERAHHHLSAGKDLYKPYEEEHWDFFKYSPTFALFFGAFAYLPDIPGLVLWNLLNVLVLFFALQKLPSTDQRARSFILLFILIEMTTSVQNAQSNALLAGLIVMAFNLLERKRYILGTLLIALSVYLKLYGIFAVIIYVFYPGKWKLALFTMMWFIILFFAPLVVVSFDYLLAQYAKWFELLRGDQSVHYGYSVMGWLHSWFGIDAPRNLAPGIGFLLLCLPLVRYKKYGYDHFRILMLASVLIWVVIFNHMAESPTFIIAMTGVAIWFFSQRMTTINLVLLLLAYVFTSLSPTDLVPDNLWESFIEPYVLKGVPCILVWIKIELEMVFNK